VTYSNADYPTGLENLEIAATNYLLR
jgi:hypothetical protein